jgi:hypothetical protein
MLAVLLLSLASLAADLREGVMGTKWGTNDEFPRPEGFEACLHRPQPSVEWECRKQLGEVPVVVHFQWEPTHKQLYGVFIFSEGVDNCLTLSGILTSAWGESKPTNPKKVGKLDPRFWDHGDVLVSWGYTPATGECFAYPFSLTARKAVEATKAAEAAKAAEGL